MERKYFKEQIIVRFFIFSALALLVWGGISYFTSPLTPILKNRENTNLNFLVLTKPAMLISYNPAIRKGSFTNLTEKETNLPLEKITKQFKLSRTPYVFIPATQNRTEFWNNFKANLSTWQRKPYQVLEYLYSYIKMRVTKKTFISTGDFIMLSYELPALRGVDFAVRETKHPKKSKTKTRSKNKNDKAEISQEQNLILNAPKQQEEDEALVVEIFNASDHNGLAGDVARYLLTLSNNGVFKVDVITFTTAKERRDTTKIIALTKRMDALKELSKHLGLVNKEIYFLEDKNAISDARIYLGEDFKLPKQAK